MSKTSRLLLLIAVAVLATAGALDLYFAPQLRTYHRFWRSRSEESELYLVPELLSNSSGASASAGIPVIVENHQFQTPWPGPTEEAKLSGYVRLFFPGGHEIEIGNPRLAQADYLGWEPGRAYQLAFGQGPPPGTNYEHLNLVLSATPKNWKPFSARGHFNRTWICLQRKFEVMQDKGAIRNIYAIGSSGYHGFEFKSLNSAFVILFDSKDRDLWIRIVSRKGKLSQPEINRIIQTFGPAPKSAAESAK